MEVHASVHAHVLEKYEYPIIFGMITVRYWNTVEQIVRTI